MSSVIDLGSKIYGLAFCKVMSEFHGDRELAHDAAVETFLSVVRKGTQAFAEEKNLINCVLFKAGKVALDLKRRRREISGCGPRIEEVAQDEESDRMRDQARHELAKAISRLAPLDREIIELYFYEDMSDNSIAACLLGESVSEQAMRKRVSRRRRAAVQQLRHWLDQSSLDWDVAIHAFSSMASNRRPAPRRRIAIPLDPSSMFDPAPESNAA